MGYNMLGDVQSKQVRRVDLHSPASSLRSSPDTELLHRVRKRLNKDITFVEKHPNIGLLHASLEQQGDDVLSFRLFTNPTPSKGTQTVRLRSASTEALEAGFVQPHRPLSYYFTDANSLGLLTEYEAVAIDGEDVILRSKQTCPGSRMPWRVTRIDSCQDRTVVAAGMSATLPSQDVSVKKMKPGKKHRIALRMKREAAESARREQQQSKLDKEAAEREKRTRRNREKKLKKKEKERIKKLAVKATRAVDDT